MGLNATAPPGSRPAAICLMPMLQLNEARDYWEDDWTGLSDLQARRKRQNRLSKRAQRRRKHPRAHSALQGFIESKSLGADTDFRKGFSTQVPNEVVGLSAIHFYNYLEERYSRREAAKSHNYLPLPVDHLITLVQFNVYRAILTNTALLSPRSTELQGCECAKNMLLPAAPHEIPNSLSPTPLQNSVSHPSWIDTFPLAEFRDNLILTMGTFDERALCLDMLGGLFHGHSGNSDCNGMIVWSDPWNISSWEVTEGFVRKWGFLLQGCHDLIRATNYWRALRNEESLVISI